MSRQIILIGGMPTSGKSVIAEQVARRLELPWLSTDHIRLIMQQSASHEDYPLLFSTDGYTAESFLEQYSPAEIADMEFRQADEVWPTIQHLIDNDHVWQRGLVLEGINITPQNVAQTYGQSGKVRAVFLSDRDESRVREVVTKRGLFGPPQETPDHLREVEVEWSQLFDAKIRHEAQDTGLPIVEMTKSPDDIDKVLTALGLGL